MGKIAPLIRGWTLPLQVAITRRFLRPYCRGSGIEIGPGSRPYGHPGNTVFLDKYPASGSGLLRPDIIGDAAHLPCASKTFDFLISSHCLEHCPNTLKVLWEWKRVLVPGGILVLILPHGERTFDRGRPLTRLEHHLQDLERGVDERDTTHWEEFERYSIPQFHHAWIPEAKRADGSWDFEWIVRNGHLHYHVWTPREMVEILEYIGCRIRVAREKLLERPDSFLIVAAVES